MGYANFLFYFEQICQGSALRFAKRSGPVSMAKAKRETPSDDGSLLSFARKLNH